MVVILGILRSQILYENSMVSIITFVLCLAMVIVKHVRYICVQYIAYQHKCTAAKFGVCQRDSKMEFLLLGITVLNQFLIAAGMSLSILYSFLPSSANKSFDQSLRKLLYWNKLFTSDNSALVFLSRLLSQRSVATGSLYGLSSIHIRPQTIKQAVWDTFVKAGNMWFVSFKTFFFLNFSLFMYF